MNLHKWVKIVIGVTVAMTGLWGGTYLDSLFDSGSWQKFPTFVTATFISLVGIIFAIYTLEE